MATSIFCPPSSSTMMIKSHLLLCYLLVLFSCNMIMISSSSSTMFVYGEEDAKDGFHSTPVSSLLPKNKCSVPAAAGSERWSRGGLAIRPRYGLSSRSGHPKPDEALDRDEPRVSSINSKFGGPHNNNHLLGGDGIFLVDVGFGTPPQQFQLILDTGSSITWIQCQLCNHCQIAAPRFNASASSTYYNGSCINSKTGNRYHTNYGDNSSSEGTYGCDTLTLEASDVFQKFQFGCGTNTTGDFGIGVDGMLGLAQGELSAVSQTAPKFNKVFSYCLPEHNCIGSLLFGEKAVSQSPSLKFTPLVSGSGKSGLDESEFYFVTLLGISVGNKRLNIPSTVFASPGTIIDSGTVITRLPQSAYSKLQAAFMKAMKKYPRSKLARQSSGDILDTCYDLSRTKNVYLPEIVLHFGGGTDLRLSGTRIIWGNDASHLCLAFAGNGNSVGGGQPKLTIIGNRQQTSLTVLYDIQRRRIGFGGNGCSQLAS